MGIKFNGNLLIPYSGENCTHGSWGSNEIKVEIRRSTDEMVIYQDIDIVRFTVDQMKQLKDFLNIHLE